MRTIEEQLSNYKSVHLNKNNIISHYLGVPLIVWAVTVLLHINTFTIELASYSLSYTPAMVLLSITVLYYFVLHAKLALGMLFYLVINYYLANLVSPLEDALSIAIITFIVGWIIQFIGHIYEKAKPAFFDDIMGLIIGPLFLMAELYFSVGLEKQLNKDITLKAIEKRRMIERSKNTSIKKSD